jgi:hypothetical protein
MSCSLEKGKRLLVINHLCVLEGNKSQLLIKEIHDLQTVWYIRSTKFRQL